MEWMTVIDIMFFFSSRRRHPIYWRDWISDVCSSDLPAARPARIRENRERLSEAFPDYIIYPPRPYRLLHVVNMALNLVGGDKLAWQQRRAESFTSTPLHSGSLFVGYRRTHQYGGNNGISLGTAVAISGAAASRSEERRVGKECRSRWSP